MSDILIWIFILFIFLIIVGLYGSESTPLDLTEKQKILLMNNSIEHFTSTSSDNSILEGASRYFNWGLPDNTKYNFDDDNKNKCDHNCDNKCPEVCPKKCFKQNVTINNYQQHKNNTCSMCDITMNKDIDKYVLKSSVPACPDMGEFVTKNMMNANPDLSDYILKSEIKSCEKVNLTNYILKSQIPACPTCPICPECPICPVCPAETVCKNINEYNIVDHSDIQNYISKDELNKDYIKKSDILNSDEIKDYIKKTDILNSDEVKKYFNKHCNKKHNENNNSNNNRNNNRNNNNDNNRNNRNNNNNNKNPLVNDIFNKNIQSPLLSDDIKGAYAGDSLYSTV
jgi:hypothetical protein